MQKPITKIISSKQMTSLVKQFRAGGYEVVKDSDTIKVSLDGEEMLWGMVHSSRTNWLTRYDSRLISEAN